ncbi:exocyst complex component 3-like protein 4 isoform X3 [Phycodurus eques]|uniref:exocyst complex component 3-like protein 4 isoform X3 n=1 Tax=Phycodurus eques TaxID=693459 RepID=UPI002ACDED34|nr:exocyst complex component 3-like protein 4 isoform X3 [Phycodurus eques]
MPQVMDTSSQIQHEDEDTTKKTSGVLETFRNGIRPVAQKSPLTPGSRGSKNQSPSTPSKAPHSPGVTSPLRSVAVLFHTEDHDDESQKGRPVMRSRTEPNVARLDSLLKKGASIRRSLRFGSKKDKPQDAFLAVRDEAEEEGEEGEAWEEMEETYTLPELPRIPLSVMQINKLIEMEVLEEAHLHLLALRAEFQRERLRLAQEDSPVELAKKEKDLSLLYADLRLKMASIVRTSVSLPARNEGLLVHVARIVQEEDKRAREPGGLQGSWMDAWREAVDRGARDKVEGVHLEPSNDGNASWLAVHLGLLGKALLEDLEKAKNELRRSYPPSFRVFATYVRAYHAAVGRHLRTLEGRATRLKDLYALLDWTVRRYRGERIMGSAALEPDMSAADADLRVDDDFLRRLRTKFCDTVKEDLRASLDRLLELENEEMWSVGKRPDTDADRLFTSVFHVDICTVRHRRATLGRRRLRRQTLARVCVCVCWRACVRTESERERGQRRARRRRAGTRRDRFVPGRAEGFPQEVRRRVPPPPPLVRASRRSAVERVPRRLRQLLQRLTPYLRRMMTRKWLTNDDDFDRLYARAELLAQHCAAARPPHGQEVASRAHYHVLKEYVGQLMKNKYSCKNRKHDEAAGKIRAQCSKLADVFHRMGSREDWLDPVGERLSDIVGQENKNHIKEHLQPLLEQYPDFSCRHLAAVLAFRGLMCGREHRRILRRLERLRKTTTAATSDDDDGRERSLFGGTEAAVRTDCLSDVSVFCFSFVFPGDELRSPSAAGSSPAWK